MSRKTDALKKAAVALGYGSAVTDYTCKTTVGILKEMAVKMQCAGSVDDIHTQTIEGVLNHIADNYGVETHEPYNLTKTETHATVTFTRKGKTISAGNDILYNGDKIKIQATATTGYDLTTLTANGTAFTSGNEFIVNGSNLAVVATGTLQTFDLARTATDCTISVTKSGSAVSDGTDVLSYGDEITISITPDEGKVITEFKVNGETFPSGNTLTVSGDVTIVGTAIAQSTE